MRPKRKFSLKSGEIIAGIVVVLLMLLIFWWLFGGEEESAEVARRESVPADAVEETDTQPFVPRFDEEGNRVAVPAPSESDGAAPSEPAEIPDWQPIPAAPEKPERLRGLTFLDAVINPLQNELDRFWGWRPNDLIQPTDNVNNFQLGVLEATRRTSIVLAERISRTGSSDPYVPELEEAMSLFAIDPKNWIFPMPGRKYRKGLDNIRKYREMLRNGTAPFYNRVDNLVPLMLSYESLLGSCTENLLRDDVGFFQSDDVFFYCQGVAAMIFSVLEGVEVDFRETIKAAQAEMVFQEIQVSLGQIVEMDPWVILNSGPNSLLANHRANMAGWMSRGRFQIHILYGALTGDL